MPSHTKGHLQATRPTAQGRATPTYTDRTSCIQPQMSPHGRTFAPRIEIRVLPSLQHVVPSAAAAHYRSFLGSPQSPVLHRFQRQSRTEAPSLHRHYPASSVVRASPPPHSALSDRHRPQVGRHDRPRQGASRVACVSLVYMPSPLPRRSDWVHSSLASPAIPAFPAWVFGSACALSFSRIAQRSLTLRPAHSLNHPR